MQNYFAYSAVILLICHFVFHVLLTPFESTSTTKKTDPFSCMTYTTEEARVLNSLSATNFLLTIANSLIKNSPFCHWFSFITNLMFPLTQCIQMSEDVASWFH